MAKYLDKSRMKVPIVFISSNSNSRRRRSPERLVERPEPLVRPDDEEFVYRVEDPEAGSWDLQVMPENAIGFSYEIVRNESAE